MSQKHTKTATKRRKAVATAKRATVARAAASGRAVRPGTAKKAAAPPAARAVPGLKGLGVIHAGNDYRLELRHDLKLTRVVFARIANVSERAVAQVESGEAAVGKLIRPYNELYRLYQALGEVVDRKSIGPWLETPNDAFDGFKPIELIERGEVDRLWNMVFELRSGMPG